MTLTAAAIELRLDLRHVSELGRADRCEVLGMREQHAPRIAQPLVKANRSVGGSGFEIRSRGADWKRSTH